MGELSGIGSLLIGNQSWGRIQSCASYQVFKVTMQFQLWGMRCMRTKHYTACIQPIRACSKRAFRIRQNPWILPLTSSKPNEITMQCWRTTMHDHRSCNNLPSWKTCHPLFFPGIWALSHCGAQQAQIMCKLRLRMTGQDLRFLQLVN